MTVIKSVLEFKSIKFDLFWLHYQNLVETMELEILQVQKKTLYTFVSEAYSMLD